MIKIMVISANKMMVEVTKKTKLEKKIYSKKDRYTFIKPNNKKRHKAGKKLSEHYKRKLGVKK